MSDHTAESTQSNDSFKFVNKFQVASVILLLISLYLPVASAYGVTTAIGDDINLLVPLLLLLSAASFGLGIGRFIGKGFLGAVYVMALIQISRQYEAIEFIVDFVGIDAILENMAYGVYVIAIGLVMGIISLIMKSTVNDGLTLALKTKIDNADTQDLKGKAVTFGKEATSKGTEFAASVKNGDVSKSDIKEILLKKPVMIGVASFVVVLVVISLMGGGEPSQEVQLRLINSEFRGYGVSDVQVGDCARDTDFDRYYDCQVSLVNAFRRKMEGVVGFNHVDGDWELDYINVN